jgi:hypothetical protein
MFSTLPRRRRKPSVPVQKRGRERPLPIRRVALTATAAALAVAMLAPNALATTPQEGVSFTAFRQDRYDGDSPERSMRNVSRTGAEWVSVLTTWYQPTIGSTDIAPTSATPTDAGVIHMVREAHALGVHVMLKPHIDLSADPGHWRGDIGALWHGRSPTWGVWFRSYRRFIYHYAILAEREGVEQFSIGCALAGTTAHARQWRRVIRGVRARFSGALTYSSSGFGEEEQITWWDAVDLIGIDAYYKLTSSPNPTVDDLIAAWTPHVEALAALSERWDDQPIVFTAIGYRSIDGANEAPWDWQTTAPIDLQEQADCYEAAFESVWGQPWFAGMFWWNWSADPHTGGPSTDTYSPFKKPAEAVLRTWY